MRYRDYIAILKEFNFKMIRNGKGSHEVWSNGQQSITVTYPEVNRMIARRELKRIGYKKLRDL